MENINHNSLFFEKEEKLDLKREFKRYLRFWPWFALSLIVVMLSSYTYLRYAPRIFQTTSKIKILDESEGLELPTSAFIFKRTNINLENEIEILTSYIILEKVVRSLNLNTSFYEEGTIQTSQIDKLPFDFEQIIVSDSINDDMTYKVFVDKNEFNITNILTEKTFSFSNHSTYSESHRLPFQVSVNPNNHSVEELEGRTFIIKFVSIKNKSLSLKSRIEVEAIGEQSDLLKIITKGESKELSEKILDSLMSVFDKDGIYDRQLVSQRTIEFIDGRFEYLAEQLDSVEVDRQDFKKKNNLVDLTADAQLGLEQRSQSDEEVFRIQTQIALTKLIEEALNDNDSTQLLPANIGLENNAINNLINDFNTAVLEKGKLMISGGVNNPAVKALKYKISDSKRNITKSLKSYINQLELSQGQLASRNLKFRGRVSQIPEQEKLLRAIERQQKIKESLYLLLLQKREEAAINLAITEPSIKVVENALSSITPISPKSKIVYIAALILGLLIPFGVLYLMFLLDSKLHSKDDIESLVSNIPVISEIPKIKTNNNLIFDDPNSKSVLAESFRILSSNASFLIDKKIDDNGKVIFCTSTIKGEGKTYVSVNLSLALSSINRKVLLIGADLRNPQIHTYIKVDKGQSGLTNYLHDQSINWNQIRIKGFDRHLNHDTIISGPIPPNPAHLLTNGRFRKLIEEAKEEYDYIIVDTAPTILVTDTMLISQLADATIYITRANFTEKNLLNFSKELSASGKFKNMAYVLNGVGASKSYNYSYNYGYGYGYGGKS